jgi:hypothetical protein
MVREKRPFYANVGTRGLLVVDRDPWRLELLQLKGRKLTTVGTSSGKKRSMIPSAVLPLICRLMAGKQRPTIEVARASAAETWKV